MKLTVVGCSPGLAEPRRRAVRLPAGGAGPPAARLRAGRARAAALERRRTAGREVDAIAITHSTSTTGATSCPGSGERCSASARTSSSPSSGSRRRARGAGRVRRAVRDPGHVRAACSSRWSTRRASSSTAAGLEVVADTAAALHGADVRLPRLEQHRTLAYSGDSGPSERLVEARRRRRPLPLRGDAGARRAGRRAARALSAEEAVPRSSVGRRPC